MINCKGFGRMRSCVFHVISWYLDGRAEETPKHMEDTFDGIAAQI